MGFLSYLQFRRRDRRSAGRQKADRGEVTTWRHCGFETMEPRRMLSASPLVLGTVYIEEDLGSDLHGDRFEVRFDGGAPDTELVRLIIDGDQNAPGFNVGDVFFDTVDGGLGADNARPFRIEELITARSDAHVEATVADGDTRLTLDLYGFQAGDRLIFSIDVDEVEYFDPTVTDLELINDGFDPITSGVEFQGSQLVAEFAAPHYLDAVGNSTFWNRYDDALAASGLDLPEDDIGGKRDRTTGGFLNAQQEVNPATISGYVYADDDNDGIRDLGEAGIGQVTLQVIPVDTIEAQATVAVITDAHGHYEATGLSPGTYRIVEVNQPNGYLDGLDAAGTVDGEPSGAAENPGDRIVDIFLGGGSDGVEYNFGEVLPATIEGTVRLTDADGRCFADGAITEPLTGVTVQLRDESGNLVLTTHTNSGGHYSFVDLLPGFYSVTEVTPSGLIDADAHAGHVVTGIRGRVVDPNTIVDVDLNAGDHGQEFDFCEHRPSTISGYVYHDRNDNAVKENNEEAIANVLVTLYDVSGNQVGTRRTGADGHYEFTGLSAGFYRVVETQPIGWLDGQETVGRVDGVPSGVVDANGDTIRNVVLRWGSEGVQYDFGELLATGISGRVHAELNQNCVLDAGEWTIEGVTIELLDQRGNVVSTTRTSSEGEYHFTDLAPGIYSVRETQPTGYFHGNQMAGSHGGDDTVQDLISSIYAGSGQQLVDYNFCEIPPSSIGGRVGVRSGPVCSPTSGQPLAGVTVELLNDDGQIAAKTVTNADGRYQFVNLMPGTYSIRETQPEGYYQGGQSAGSGGGDDSSVDLISTIAILPGVDLVDYNFCELLPATISGYVFQDGAIISTVDGAVPTNLSTVRDGQRSGDDTAIPGVVVELRFGVLAELMMGDQVLIGPYSDGPIRTVTDANGYYEFVGLPSGNYSVYEVQPESYVDGIDTVGTTDGIAVNDASDFDPEFIRRFAQHPNNDAIVYIAVSAGQDSLENNFSEVRVEQVMPQLPPPLPIPPIWNPISVVLPPTIAWTATPQMQPGVPNSIPIMGSSGSPRMSWHLSVVNGGSPRSVDLNETNHAWRTVSFPDVTQWNSFVTDEGQWAWPENVARYIGESTEEIVFGVRDALPISGDFNGDGVSEIGMFIDGYWFIDLNGNGRWDENDLWALLGSDDDLPVVGDWDGDGKDDIGIFGPEWLGDKRAIKAEPGLPDPQNVNRPVPKNLPPEMAEATNGHRLLKRTAGGRPRLDVIDHVFRFGVSQDMPVAGDWNGDGISTVGLFRDGMWHLDTDGDGRFTERDETVQMGQAGDVPIVGDFDGNGIDDLGIFRNGIWYLDTDGNRSLDAHDQVFQMGEMNDKPVVGDYDGDGRDDPATYRDAG